MSACIYQVFLLNFDPVLLRYRQHSLALMEAYDPRRNVWLKLANMASPCSGLGACALFGLLYTVGASVVFNIRAAGGRFVSRRALFLRWEAGT